MSKAPKINTTFQERSDFEDTIQSIEANQRHDLAVHLYLTFLLHQVNPHYPPLQWASWPAYPLFAVDPQTAANGEDFVLTALPYASRDRSFYQAVESRSHGIKHDPRNALLLLLGTQVGLKYKRQRLASPHTTLVNEMHFVLQRKLQRLARKLRNVRGIVTLTDDSAMMQNMATRLANRLGRVVAQIASQPRRIHQSVNGTRSAYFGGWQDVAMANLYNDRLSFAVDIAAHRKFYQHLRELFYNAPFAYEYDPEAYYDEETGIPEDVPRFDIEQNLHAIESVGLSPEGLPRAQDLIQRGLADRAYKERVFYGLVEQVVREKQLSWQETPKLLGAYLPAGDLYAQRRRRVSRELALRARDFYSGVRRTQ